MNHGFCRHETRTKGNGGISSIPQLQRHKNRCYSFIPQVMPPLRKVKEKRVNGFLGIGGEENSTMDGLLRHRRWE
ncbi:hypothetical protein Lal_00031263 [Lupinus albus]|nr:hypothetical protein Lal_00031263 [Lupinus albus]